MKSDRIRVAALLLCLLLLRLPFPLPAACAETDGMVRVRLTRLGSPASLSFTTDCVYCLNGEEAYALPSGSEVTVRAAEGTLVIETGGRSYEAGSSLTMLRTQKGTHGVRFTKPALGNLYCGDLRFTLSGGTVVTILTLHVEDYLCGVVGYEMSNSFPQEALKAQAVAARNYVLRAASSRSGKAWDVKDNTEDQVFRGYNAAQTNVIRAVDETAGWVLTYGGSLAACFYGASNGGQTESTRNVWGSSLSYSVVRDDPYDLASSAAKRSISVPEDWSGIRLNAAFESALRESMRDAIGEAADRVEILGVTALAVEDPKYAEPSRLYRTLRFTLLVSDGEERAEVPAAVATYGAFEKWFSLSINSSDNETVWVERTDGGWTVTFRRYGHGVGLSQRGAQTMAKDYGMTAAEILAFYYPGTKAEHLSLRDTTGSGIRRGAAKQTAAPVETPEPTAAPTAKPTAAPTAAPAPAEGITAYVNVSAGSRLNVRAAASSAGKVLGSLKAGTQVTVYAVRGEWAYLTGGGLTGYCAKQYLSLTKPSLPEPTAKPTAAPTVKPTKAPASSAVIAQVSGTGGSRLNVRAAASSAGKVLGSLKAGTYVCVTAVSGSWAKIRTASGLTGWSAVKYLTRVK